MPLSPSTPISASALDTAASLLRQRTRFFKERQTSWTAHLWLLSLSKKKSAGTARRAIGGAGAHGWLHSTPAVLLWLHPSWRHCSTKTRATRCSSARRWSAFGCYTQQRRCSCSIKRKNAAASHRCRWSSCSVALESKAFLLATLRAETDSLRPRAEAGPSCPAAAARASAAVLPVNGSRARTR